MTCNDDYGAVCLNMLPLPSPELPFEPSDANAPLRCYSLSIICKSLFGIGGVARLISVLTFSTSVTQLLQKVVVVDVEHHA